MIGFFENEKTILPEIRLRKLRIYHVRNIDYSEIDFPNSKVDDLINYQSSVLGIYGQNGSGKTTAIIALKVLRSVVAGYGADEIDKDLIQSGFESCRFEYEFCACCSTQDKYDIIYCFDIRMFHESHEYDVINLSKSSDSEGHSSKKVEVDYVPRIVNEKLKFRHSSNDNKGELITLIETGTGEPDDQIYAFGNKKRFKEFRAQDNIREIFYWKQMAAMSQRSFIFFSGMYKWLIMQSPNDEYNVVLKSIYTYCNSYLHILTGNELIRYDDLSRSRCVIDLWREEADGYGIVPLVVDEQPDVISASEYDDLKRDINRINCFVGCLIPGFALCLIEYERGNYDDLTRDPDDDEISKDTNEAESVDDSSQNKLHVKYMLHSKREQTIIPLTHESAGVRRLISLASLIIAMYNDPSVTIAIDELDSGIFEYLLGDLLSVLNEHGKGQLIFTSHNFRALEVLDRNNLLFTSFDSPKRFIKLPNISGNNNLRDSYFRTIMLGDGSIYKKTDQAEIRRGLIKAGCTRDTEAGDSLDQ